MQVQPDPCPFAGVMCREFSVQTKTKTAVQWTQRCFACGRVIIKTVYDTKPVAAEDIPVETRERWKRREVGAHQSTRRERHRTRVQQEK